MHIYGFMRLANLEDPAFAGEFHALLRHGLCEVVNLHPAIVIGLIGGRQGSRRLAYSLVCGEMD